MKIKTATSFLLIVTIIGSKASKYNQLNNGKFYNFLSMKYSFNAHFEELVLLERLSNKTYIFRVEHDGGEIGCSKILVKKGIRTYVLSDTTMARAVYKASSWVCGSIYSPPCIVQNLENILKINEPKK